MRHLRKERCVPDIRVFAWAGLTTLSCLSLVACGRSPLDLPIDADSDAAIVSRDAGRGTGGVVATGGAPSSIVTGGAAGHGSGGFATGGAGGAGGLTGRGGNAGAGTGGKTAAGGAASTGGQAVTGGVTAAGGRAGAGGALATGGSTGKGGSAGAGVGGATSTGGKKGTGGATGTGGTSAGGSGGAGGAGGSVPDAIQALASAFCAAAKSCCVSSYPSANLADCESKFPSRLQVYPLVEKGTVTIDQTALSVCIGVYKAAASTCTMTGLEAACHGVFVGAQGEGQACGGTGKFGSYECKPINGTESCYWQDSKSYPNKPGICASIPRGKSGDVCSTTCLLDKTCVVDMIGGAAPFSASCFEEDGLYCSVASNPAVCKPILHLGDACTWDPNCCGSGGTCSGMSNTCVTYAKVGEPCSYAYCRDDLTCSNGNKCVEQPFASDSVCKGTPSVP
jgi:hypothetical protein